MSMYEKISPELFEHVSDLKRSVILFDPSEIYSRIKFDKFKRRQSFSMRDIAPTRIKGICACGCERKLYGRQTRWFSEECQNVPAGVLHVLNGDLDYINGLMQCYLPHRCVKCNCENYLIEKSQWSDWHKREIVSYSASGIQVDHIVAIQNGGSAAWLGNYQFLCHRCHSIKTKHDNMVKRQRLSGGIEQQSLFPARTIKLF